MINISSKLSQDTVDWFLTGFLCRLKYRLFNSPQPVRLEFGFEKKFYRSLYFDAQFAREFINMSPLDMEGFYKTDIFLKHRLFFLLCLPVSIRRNNNFIRHYQNEMKNIPRDIGHQGIEDTAESVRARAVKLFDYGTFGKKPKQEIVDLSLWNAYSFLKKIGVKVCPICNVSPFKLLIRSREPGTGELKSRPALDHYLCKSKFPFFGVNVRNLVPNCTTCNSGLKGDKDFMATVHLNPYYHSLLDTHSFKLCFDNHGLSRFFVNVASADQIDEDDFSIDFTERCNSEAKRVENSISTFELPLQYDETKLQFIDFISDLPLINKNFLKAQMEILDQGSMESAAKKYLKIPKNTEDTCHGALKHSLFDIYIRPKIN